MENINNDNLPTYDEVLRDIKEGLSKKDKFFDHKYRTLAREFVNQKEYSLQKFIEIELTKKLFNNVKTEEVLKELHIDNINNNAEEESQLNIVEEEESQLLNEGWKAWLHFFSNYNVLSALNLYDEK